MRKDKDSAYSKREAFKSFLVAPSTIEDTAPKTHSDAEEVCITYLHLRLVRIY